MDGRTDLIQPAKSTSTAIDFVWFASPVKTGPPYHQVILPNLSQVRLFMEDDELILQKSLDDPNRPPRLGPTVPLDSTIYSPNRCLIMHKSAKIWKC